MIALLLLGSFIAPADLVIENAKIWTDSNGQFTSFAAIDNGRFVYVGERNASYIGGSTTHIDARGAIVIPGVIDSHIHMIGGGESLSQLDLRGAKNKEEFVAQIREWSAKLGPNDWVIGGGWSVESWPVQDAPSKEWLDGVTGGRPAFLERMDGHSCVVNSTALKLAGITKTGPMEVPGGVIDRDATGEPTGILRENAAGLVSRLIPSPTAAVQLANLKRAIRFANEHGITSVCDIPGLGNLSTYEAIAKDRDLSMRLFLYPTTSGWENAIGRVRGFKGKSGWVEVNGLKAYMDGSLGSHTAYMHEPFTQNPPDKPDWRGVPMPGALNGEYAKDFQAASRAGLQAIVHAIGDEGNHLLLDLLEKNYSNLKAARCRSEHAQHLLPGDIKRFADLGVIASMQPYHKADDGRYAEKHIGAERCHSSYAYKMLLEAGAKLAFGSDWPVVTLDPFLGMEAAVTGRILTGKIWEPQNNITVDQALRAYTSDAAYAAFEEKEIGRIAPGYRADFVILNRSPWSSGVDWKQITPTLVYVEGKMVYRPEK